MAKMKVIDLSSLAEKWPSGLVPRQRISDFTMGLVKEHSLAMYDSLGAGPKGRFKVGRKVVYPVKEVISWLEDRSSVDDE